MESVIKWQTGQPKESDVYLVTIKGTYSDFVTSAYFSSLTGWEHFREQEIIAWCKMRNIEPYKEDK